MASTNALQFNPTQANQLTDAAYVTDPTRTGGAALDGIWPSDSANKTLYQVSTYVTALAKALVNKGFSNDDTNLATLTAVMANLLTTADVVGALQQLPYLASQTLNCAAYSGFQISLAGNTSLALTGQTAGEVVGLIFVQDAAGGHTVTFPAGTVGGAQPDPAPNVLSLQLFKVNASLNLMAVGPSVSANGMTGLAINAPSLIVASAAPAGQVLTGNGVSYVPQVAPGFSSGSSGGAYWQRDPSGLIRQWSSVVAVGASSASVSFPTNFTNVASVAVSLTSIDFGSYPIRDQVYLTSLATNGFSAGTPGSTISFSWMAVGY